MNSVLCNLSFQCYLTKYTKFEAEWKSGWCAAEKGWKIGLKFGVFRLTIGNIYTPMPKLAKIYPNSFNYMGRA